MISSEDIIHLCDEVLNEKTCNILCRKSSFIQRSSSKLKGFEFIKAMIIPSKDLSMDSLQGLCKRIKEFNSEVDITAQALCQRINDVSSRDLMKNVFATLLQYMHSRAINKCPILNKALGQFNDVFIEDSTVCKLHEKLQEKFKGVNRGGSGAKSQVKIDLIYSIMKGQLVNVEVFNGNEPDQSLAYRIIKFIKSNDLIIRDLGYFVLNSVRKIVEIGAYFLSRLLSNIKIYLNKNDLKPIDLGKYLERKFRGFSMVDLKQVYLGEEKVPSRLVVYRLPKNIVVKKLQEANKRAKDTGRQMSKGKKLSLQFAMFVTNVPAEMLATEIVGTIYRLRWEIELVFKRWKSSLDIDYLKGINVNRIECLIWSRLCTVLVIELVCNFISAKLQEICSGREISHAKLVTYILRESKFCEAVAKNKLEEYLIIMEKDARRMLVKDKRKRRSMRQRVCEFECYYELQPSNFQKVA